MNSGLLSQEAEAEVCPSSIREGDTLTIDRLLDSHQNLLHSSALWKGRIGPSSEISRSEELPNDVGEPMFGCRANLALRKDEILNRADKC